MGSAPASSRSARPTAAAISGGSGRMPHAAAAARHSPRSCGRAGRAGGRGAAPLRHCNGLARAQAPPRAAWRAEAGGAVSLDSTCCSYPLQAAGPAGPAAYPQSPQEDPGSLARKRTQAPMPARGPRAPCPHTCSELACRRPSSCRSHACCQAWPGTTARLTSALATSARHAGCMLGSSCWAASSRRCWSGGVQP